MVAGLDANEVWKTGPQERHVRILVSEDKG